MLQIQSFTFNPIQENTYLLYNELKECIIIDPGCYFDEEKQKLQSFITENGLKPKLLLNTHCHLDHTFGNKFISETYNLVLHIHPLEKKVLEYGPTSGLMYNLPFDNYGGELIYLNEKEKIIMSSDELEVLFTPGHSPGSVCFYCARQNFVIGGDVLFQRSIGRTDLPGGDYDTLIDSIQTKLFILPGKTEVHSGHGERTTIEDEKLYNPFFN
ncbi:MAG: MBL fold metallo-hydrolase [Chitinophagaceae bacterium]|nr:MBL fold metallo-hydrolase [Chitinophagaceae bacterium]